MAHGYKESKGYTLIRRKDGAHMPDGKIRYSKRGANLALWEFVRWRVVNRLVNEYNYDEDTAYSIREVFHEIQRNKYSLQEANVANRLHRSRPVTNKDLDAYSKARLEEYGEWDIVEVKVAL